MLYVCLQKAVFCDFYVFIAHIDNHNFCMFFLLAIFKWLPKDLEKKKNSVGKILIYMHNMLTYSIVFNVPNVQ